MTNNDLNDNFQSTLLVDNQIVKHNSKATNSPQIGPSVHTIFIANAQDLNSETTQTVRSMAQACQLTEDVYTILPANTPWYSWRTLEQVKNIVLFGNLEPILELNINLPLHYIYAFDHRTWIKTVSLLQLTQDKAAKTALWNTALKKHFLP